METTAGRRRSQRLFLQVRIVVEGTLANKSPFSEETHTIIVNAHGALVEMGRRWTKARSSPCEMCGRARTFNAR